MPDLVRVGRVGKPHGLDGSFAVEDASEDESRFVVGASVVVGGRELRVVGSRRARGRPVIRLEEQVPRGATLEVPREALAAPAADAYYVADLVGLDVEEEGGRRLGRVRDVAPGPANDMLELDAGLALPMVEACVLEVDLDARRILVARGFSDPL